MKKTHLLFIFMFALIVGILTQLPLSAEGTKSGDIYSGVGDWTITQPTVYRNESETVAGDIHINVGGSLIFDNGTLDFSVAAPDVNIDGSCDFINANLTNAAGETTYHINTDTTFILCEISKIDTYFLNFPSAGTYRVISSNLYSCGVYAYGSSATDLVVSNCVIHPEVEGIFAVDIDSLVIKNSIIEDPIKRGTPQGISCNGEITTTISGNEIRNFTTALYFNDDVPDAIDNNTFENATRGVDIDLTTNPTLKINNGTFTNITYPINGNKGSSWRVEFYNCSGIPEGSVNYGDLRNRHYGIYVFSHITILDVHLNALQGAQIVLRDRFDNEIFNGYTDLQGQATYIPILIEEDYRAYNPQDLIVNFKEVTFNDLVNITKTENRTISLETPWVFDFHIKFFNSFTGFGEDANLLKIYYNTGGGWVRAPESYFTVSTTQIGDTVQIQARDYFDYVVDTQEITITGVRTIIVDFGIPIAVLHLDNEYDISQFNVSRNGVTYALMGDEMRIIAAEVGNSTLEYEISWVNTTVVLENGTTRTIPNGSWAITAEAEEENNHILANIGVKMKPTYSTDTVESVSTELDWEKIKMITWIISAIMLPIAAWRSWDFLRRKARGE